MPLHNKFAFGLIGGLALTLSACGGAEQSVSSESVTRPLTETSVPAAHVKTKAVLVYAKWCGSCKILDPKLKAVQAKGPYPGLDFVTLDYSEKNVDDFYAQARAAGVEEAVRAYLDGSIKTGILLLVDVDDAKVIGTITKDKNGGEIMSAISDAMAAS